MVAKAVAILELKYLAKKCGGSILRHSRGMKIERSRGISGIGWKNHSDIWSTFLVIQHRKTSTECNIIILARTLSQFMLSTFLVSSSRRSSRNRLSLCRALKHLSVLTHKWHFCYLNPLITTRHYTGFPPTDSLKRNATITAPLLRSYGKRRSSDSFISHR